MNINVSVNKFMLTLFPRALHISSGLADFFQECSNHRRMLGLFNLEWGWVQVVLCSGSDRGDQLQRHTPAPVMIYWRPCTALPSRQNFVCLVRSRLRCHVRRHRHARNKGKFGSFAFLHTTPSDYIRSHWTSYFTLWQLEIVFIYFYVRVVVQ